MPFVQSSPEGNLNQFGWPHFQGEGSAVASLANAIAAQKYKQTQDFQKTLAGSIQEMQAQRAANAALEQAGAMGLNDPGALKGMGISGLGAYSELAKLIDFQKKEAERERLNKSLIDWRTGGGAGGARGRVADPDNPGASITSTQLFNRRKSQAATYGKQASDIESEQQGFGLPANVPAGFGYMKDKDGNLRYATTPEEQAKPDLVSPTDILQKSDKGPVPIPGYTAAVESGEKTKMGQPLYPTFTKDVYAQRQARAKEQQDALAKQKAIQDKMLNTAPDAGDQGGAAPALSAQDQQALDWAQANPNDQRAAKIRARLGYGG